MDERMSRREFKRLEGVERVRVGLLTNEEAARAVESAVLPTRPTGSGILRNPARGLVDKPRILGF